jgi:predicted ATPase
MLDLRSATNLARLWSQQGRHDEARAMLGPLLAAFTEGHDLHDLRLERTILDG